MATDVWNGESCFKLAFYCLEDQKSLVGGIEYWHHAVLVTVTAAVFTSEVW
jgi:hypothetical protein